MRKILFSGVALLALSSGARAAQDTIPLTDPLIGQWCYSEKAKTYRRAGACNPDGRTSITHDGIGGHEVSCTFINIKPIQGGYETTQQCEVVASVYWFWRTKLQIVGKTLKIEEIQDLTILKPTKWSILVDTLQNLQTDFSIYVPVPGRTSDRRQDCFHLRS
jgi:hypothetical protein